MTDWASGKPGSRRLSHYLYGMDAKGRATIKAFADRRRPRKEQQTSPGNLVTWDVLRAKELATRCAFCDRAVYPEDACGVKFGTTHGYGCCTHCSMGVAARLKQDIEVEAKDGLLRRDRSGSRRWMAGRLAGTANGHRLVRPEEGAEGKWVSAGCFKQGSSSARPTCRSGWTRARR